MNDFKVKFVRLIYFYLHISITIVSILENDILGEWGLTNTDTSSTRTKNTTATNLWQEQSDEAAAGLHLDDVSSNFGKILY